MGDDLIAVIEFGAGDGRRLCEIARHLHLEDCLSWTASDQNYISTMLIRDTLRKC